MTWDIKSPVPSGGMFIVPAMNKPLLFCLALLIGSIVTGLILFFTKKTVTKDDEVLESGNGANEPEEEIDLDDIKFDE